MWTRVVVVGSILALSSPVVAKPPAPTKLAVTLPIVEVLDPVGSVAAPQVKEAIVKVEGFLAKCADDAKWAGDALVWLVTDWRGKVIKAEVAADKATVERCLVVGLKRLVIPKAQSRATTMMRVRFAAAKPSIADELE